MVHVMKLPVQLRWLDRSRSSYCCSWPWGKTGRCLSLVTQTHPPSWSRDLCNSPFRSKFHPPAMCRQRPSWRCWSQWYRSGRSWSDHGYLQTQFVASDTTPFPSEPATSVWRCFGKRLYRMLQNDTQLLLQLLCGPSWKQVSQVKVHLYGDDSTVH